MAANTPSSLSSQKLPNHKRKQQHETTTALSAVATDDPIQNQNKRVKTTNEEEETKNKILRGIPFHPTMKDDGNGNTDLMCSVFENIDPPLSTGKEKNKGGGGENAKRVATFAYECVKVMYPDLDEDMEKMFEVCKTTTPTNAGTGVPESQLGRDLCIIMALATIPPFRERLRPYCKPEWFEPFCERIGHLAYIYIFGHHVKSSKPGRVKGCMPSYAGVEDFVMQMRTFYRTGVEYHEPGLRDTVVHDKSH
jgi:hypothetical protein